METDLTYWDVRKIVQHIIPRQTVFGEIDGKPKIRKGRRAGYQEFNIQYERWNKYERVLAEDRMDSVFEVSLKASGCPSPFNMDVWDGKVCPFNCSYCFANYFRATLYENFFDRVPKGVRHADYEDVARQLDELVRLRGRNQGSTSPVRKAASLNIPLRMGVRFENFIPHEKREGLALKVLRFLASKAYPVLIDTKSDLIAEDAYLEALSSNKGGAVVQIRLSSSDNRLLKAIEPGAPSADRRFEALKKLNEAGIRGTPRIEPFLPFIADQPDDVATYIDKCKEAGVGWINFDAFSYSCANAFTRRMFMAKGLDFDRMFYAASDSRMLTGIMLWSMMEHFRSHGFKCSTYDDMNSYLNDDPVNCCNVAGAIENAGINYGSSKAAERYIKEKEGHSVSWAEYRAYVEARGGFLSKAHMDEFRHMWNNEGNPAYNFAWNALQPVGADGFGLVWAYPGFNPSLARALTWINLEAERVL